MRRTLLIIATFACLGTSSTTASAAQEKAPAFFEAHCHSCHAGAESKGGLDLLELEAAPVGPETFALWLKVYDRVDAGEMPPPKRKRPAAEDWAKARAWLRDSLLADERTKAASASRPILRRLTRVEYENTVRDLLDLPGIALKDELPADGSGIGFDTNADGLDISHVTMAAYVEAAEKAIDMAVATRPTPPKPIRQRISLANRGGGVAYVLLQGHAVALKDKKPDANFPPAGKYQHIDENAHDRMGMFDNASVGLFLPEYEGFSAYFVEFATVHPGFYRLRTPLWSFLWDKGQVLPSRGTEAARLSIVHLIGDGTGLGHPSRVLGYYDAPSIREKVHEITTWLNYREIIGFNTATLAALDGPMAPNRLMGRTATGIACDYLEIEGPLFDQWPPRSHERLFGKLPLVAFQKTAGGVRPPDRKPIVQEIGLAKNRPDPVRGIWTVRSDRPTADADQLLGVFLRRAFRRPVPAELRNQYVALVSARMKAGDCFEDAMRFAYRAALCSPEFLYHIEPQTAVDDHALASRLSYFFWRSMPDQALSKLADEGKLHQPETLHAEIGRLMADPRFDRFVEDFLAQWLRLREIAATDPDKKLYPEFSPYLQDSFVAETRAYFRELLAKDLGAAYFVKSDFAMLNQELATLYGVPGVEGSQIRRVKLPAGSARGPFLSQGSILKITANGTVTSPVPRGAFVLDRLLGRPPDPPPATVPAIEPDVRGATTIREQLNKHRSNAACASCHARIDPPGFALEGFDVIGGERTRYRSIGSGDKAPRGSIDPLIHIVFKLGPPVEPSGTLPDGRTFRNYREFQDLLAADPRPLLANFARQLTAFGLGRRPTFTDRVAVEAVVDRAMQKGGGIRTLVYELLESPLFRGR